MGGLALGLLPGGVRESLGGVVEGLGGEPGVVAVGLVDQGVSTSGVFDFLVVAREGPGFEFHEMLDVGDFLVDLDWVPYEWVGAPVSPVVDHRLQGAVVLHDPEGVLGWAVAFVGKNYRSPGRVDVRADGCLARAEMFLSRASAAASRGDLETAELFSGFCWEPVARLVMDVAGVPAWRGDLAWGFRRACLRLGADAVWGWFVSRSGVSGLDLAGVERCVGMFEDVWFGVSDFLAGEGEAVRVLHGRLSREIGYLTGGLLLRRVLGRLEELVDSCDPLGATLYMRGWLLPLLEGYAWVLSSGVEEKYDYVSLFRVLRELGEPSVLEGALEVFGVSGLGEGAVLGEIDAARGVVGGLRADRRGLLEGTG